MAWDGVGSKDEAEEQAKKNCNVVAVPMQLFEHMKEVERRMVEAEAVPGKLLAAHRAADEERLKETEEAHAEAARWKAEGDMYGWNFHEGRAGGTTAASIIFFRLQREIKGAMKACR